MFFNRNPFALLLLLLLGCTSDPTPLPSELRVLSLSGKEITSIRRSVGSHIHFTVQLDAPSGFEKMSAFVTINGMIDELLFEHESSDAEKEFTSRELTMNFEESHIDQEVFLVIEVIDSFDEPTVLEIPVTVFTSDLLILSDWQIEATTSDGLSRSFFASQNGIRNSSNSIKATIPEFADQVDIGYYYGTNGMASLASPIAYQAMENESSSENIMLQSQVEGWLKLNTTIFKSALLTRDDFFLIFTVDEVNQVFEDGTDPTPMKANLEIGDVLAFETDTNKLIGSERGLIQIEDIVDGDSNGEFNGRKDYIVLNIVAAR